VSTFIVRVWVPDRPGALGAVASRIGAVRGEIVGIDILERGGGRAIDELVVELADETLVPLLVGEVGQVDGVDVEDVRPAPAHLGDSRVDALETAAVLVAATTSAELLTALAGHGQRDFEADWSAVVDLHGDLLASEGAPPPPGWLAAFLSGSSSSSQVASGECGPDDVAWAELPGARLALVLGRRGRPFRARERRQLGMLGRITASRLTELPAVMSARGLSSSTPSEV
jgi:hypothetical protein